jgi:hypothetical protein
MLIFYSMFFFSLLLHFPSVHLRCHHLDAQPDGPPRVGLWVLLENALASCGDRGQPTHVVFMAASKSFGMVLMQNALKAEWNTAAAALECASNASEAFSAPQLG